MNPINPVSCSPSSSDAPAPHSCLDLTHLAPEPAPQRKPEPDPDSKMSETASKIEKSKVILLDRSHWSHGIALVVGVSRPSNSQQFKTVAIDSHDFTSFVEKTKADFPVDILDFCEKREWHGKFSRIVFCGCCPITRAMGGGCSSMKGYQRQILPDLAEKVSKLVSDKGGFLFFRHCVEGGKLTAIENKRQRERFKAAFQNCGFILVTHSTVPYRIKNDKPVSDLPDPAHSLEKNWDGQNGGMIFYKPPINS